MSFLGRFDRAPAVFSAALMSRSALPNVWPHGSRIAARTAR